MDQTYLSYGFTENIEVEPITHGVGTRIVRHFLEIQMDPLPSVEFHQCPPPHLPRLEPSSFKKLESSILAFYLIYNKFGAGLPRLLLRPIHPGGGHDPTL
jgi:hypothetical protein